VPGVNLAHAVGGGWAVGPERGADISHECQGGLWRRPDSQHQGTVCRRIAEAVPVPARRHEHRARCRFLRLIVAGHQQPPAEHVDGFVECVVGMRDRPGEVSGDGQLHDGKTGRLAVLAGQDAHGLPGVGEHWSLAAACQQGHGLFLSSGRGAPAAPASSR
jgi:hypothetical protein